METSTDSKQVEAFGEGRFLKNCAGCKKPFRTNGRNARLGPSEMCKCAARRVQARNKRRRERRAYHKNPEYHRQHSRIRAEARKAMEWYLRSNDLEPHCAHAGCDKQGWAIWKGTLQVHHTHGGDLPPNPPQDGNGGWVDVLCFLQVTCQKHHGHFDHCVEKSQLPVLWAPPAEQFLDFLVRVRRETPKRFYLTPTKVLAVEWRVLNGHYW